MIRTFHSIGQGAFYCENFDGKFRIIYDCGSDSGVEFIEKDLLNSFEKGTCIDALFLSHLHNDHVNGVQFLLTHCDVKNLFLPLLDKEDAKIALMVSNAITGVRENNSFIEKLVVNRQEFINGDTRVTYVPVYEYNEKMEPSNIYLEDYEGNWRDGYRLVSKKIPGWTFVPFNFEHKERVISFQKELFDRGLSIKSIDDFKNKWSNIDNRKKIIDSYRATPSDLNKNSLVLYSGPEISNNVLCHCHPFKRNFVCLDQNIVCLHQTGCIYFGDYYAAGQKEWAQFYSCYLNYIPSTGIIQIPHHGSKHSYNQLINKNIKGLSIISAGTKNKYRHPHSSVVRDIAVSQGCPLIVTEDPNSKITCYIKY